MRIWRTVAGLLALAAVLTLVANGIALEVTG